ncbi:FliH/SctL family protein [Selenomonas artemidis]|uniref:Flagellar assembly protein FliH n=1 Tax=Selenomonas artemidis F0399 TaxID=749551 RepID=E7N0N5_9FIRM|nr:FliH/SctL family protein [Selenomonas artemidis]EFW30243.1 flagellar assembly protein FliH [Selenomonas artemidis F0399]
MSRVIKAAVWEENPHLIDVPPPPPPPREEGEAEALSEEAVQNLLARIAEREQAMDERVKEAEIQVAVLHGEAEEERDRLLSEAQTQIENDRAEARAAGHAEGFAAGHAEGEAAVREEMAELIRTTNVQAEKTLRDAHDAMRDYLMQAEEDIVSIAMTAVERILPQHFIDVPQMVLPIVRDAILRVKDQKEVVVHVPPDSYDFVLMARDELRGLLTAGDTNLTITSDEAMKPGDCLVETPNGSVDARLQTQIEQLKKAVREVML